MAFTIALSDQSKMRPGHPWAARADLIDDGSIPDCATVVLMDADGSSQGTGIFDRRDCVAVWRRFSWADGADFDETYLLNALQAAVERRADEPTRRLIFSDSDYVPGLLVDQFDRVLVVTIETAAVARHQQFIGSLLLELTRANEVVFLNDVARRMEFDLPAERMTLSGNNFKRCWVSIDEVAFRLDPLNPDMPQLPLELREQFILVASLCEGRCVCDAFAGMGGFALHAARAGAEHVVALDVCETPVKALGAAAQKNGCFIETIHSEAEAFFTERVVGELEVIILNPSLMQCSTEEALIRLHEKAFSCLQVGGILATYCHAPSLGAEAFERLVSLAAAYSGRDARVFARTTQPFDFPMLLNFPESRLVNGLIVELV